MNTPKNYGRVIRALRQQRAWTQEQLAAISDLSARTIQRIERESVEPASETLMALASAFEIDVKAIIQQAEMPELDENQFKKFLEQIKDIDFLPRITHGHNLVQMLHGTHLFYHHHDPLENGHEAELVGGFLQNATDLGDILNDIGPKGRADTEISLTRELHELEAEGFWIFGMVKKRKLSIPKGTPPTDWNILHLIVLRKDHPAVVRPEVGKELLPADLRYDECSISF